MIMRGTKIFEIGQKYYLEDLGLCSNMAEGTAIYQYESQRVLKVNLDCYLY